MKAADQRASELQALKVPPSVTSDTYTTVHSVQPARRAEVEVEITGVVPPGQPLTLPATGVQPLRREMFLPEVDLQSLWQDRSPGSDVQGPKAVIAPSESCFCGAGG